MIVLFPVLTDVKAAPHFVLYFNTLAKNMHSCILGEVTSYVVVIETLSLLNDPFNGSGAQ